MDVAEIIIQTMPDRRMGLRKAHHFWADIRTVAFARALYDIHIQAETFWDAKKLLPIRFASSGREAGKEVYEHELFDHHRLKASFFYKDKTEGGDVFKREEVTPIPRHFQDGFSIFQFIRGLPHLPGQTYVLPVVGRGSVFSIKVKALPKETIRIGSQEHKAVKFNLRLPPRRDVRKGKKKKDAKTKMRSTLLWLSDDEFRKILKFDAKIKFGRIYGYLKSYEPGTGLGTNIKQKQQKKKKKKKKGLASLPLGGGR